jgi:hypothetical protein
VDDQHGIAADAEDLQQRVDELAVPGEGVPFRVVPPSLSESPFKCTIDGPGEPEFGMTIVP